MKGRTAYTAAKLGLRGLTLSCGSRFGIVWNPCERGVGQDLR